MSIECARFKCIAVARYEMHSGTNININKKTTTTKKWPIQRYSYNLCILNANDEFELCAATLIAATEVPLYFKKKTKFFFKLIKDQRKHFIYVCFGEFLFLSFHTKTFFYFLCNFFKHHASCTCANNSCCKNSSKSTIFINCKHYKL